MPEQQDCITFSEQMISSLSIVAFSCFPLQSDVVIKTKALEVHIWEVFLSDYLS